MPASESYIPYNFSSKRKKGFSLRTVTKIYPVILLFKLAVYYVDVPGLPGKRKHVIRQRQDARLRSYWC